MLFHGRNAELSGVHAGCVLPHGSADAFQVRWDMWPRFGHHLGIFLGLLFVLLEVAVVYQACHTSLGVLLDVLEHLGGLLRLILIQHDGLVEVVEDHGDSSLLNSLDDLAFLVLHLPDVVSDAQPVSTSLLALGSRRLSCELSFLLDALDFSQSLIVLDFGLLFQLFAKFKLELLDFSLFWRFYYFLIF